MRHLIVTALLSLLVVFSCVALAQDTETYVKTRAEKRAESERIKLEKKQAEIQRKLNKLQPSSTSAQQPAAVRVTESHPTETVTQPATAPESTTAPSCDSITDSLEREVCFRARAIEAQKQAEQLRHSRIKADSSVMRQARKQITAEERERVKDTRVIHELIRNAEVSGCESDEPVQVNPVGQHTSRWVSTANVRVTNYGKLPISIESSRPGYGTLVKNLCSGGSVSLHFALRPFADPNYLQIPLRAIARTPDGRIATSDFQVYLSAFDSQNERERNLVWGVNLNLQSQIR